MTRTWTGYNTLVTLLGTFAVVLAVNVFFMVKAYSTFRGEDEQKPYMQGVEYNETLERRALQARLGWTATLDAARTGESGVRVAVSLSDHAGAPINTVSLSALLKHPSDEAKDRVITLHRVSSGAYEGDAANVSAGLWDLVVSATNAPATPFEATRRIWIR
jgi:nitrogen fixation protein FixH